MLENIIKEKLKKEFFPFNDSKIEALKASNAYRAVKVNGCECLFLRMRSKAMVTIFCFIKSGEKEVLLANIGENLDFPRIVCLSNLETEIEETYPEFKRALELIYGNGFNITFLSNGKQPNLERIEGKRTIQEDREILGLTEEDVKNPLLYFILRKHQLQNISRFHKNKNTKVITFMESIVEFVSNVISNTMIPIEELSPKRFVSLENSLSMKIFESVLTFNADQKMSLHLIQNNRAIFIGYNFYNHLMKKVKYNRDSWNNFLDIQYLNNFKEKFKTFIETNLEKFLDGEIHSSLKEKIFSIVTNKSDAISFATLSRSDIENTLRYIYDQLELLDQESLFKDVFEIRKEDQVQKIEEDIRIPDIIINDENIPF